MFIGEMGCWFVVGAASLLRAIQSRRGQRAGYQSISAEEEVDPRLRPSSPAASADTDIDTRAPLHGHRLLLLALPACCDIAGTTLMNVGLLFVAASIYQMTRGALVLFVGLFSVIFLGRRLAPAKWAALCIVVAGVAVVGLAGVVSAPSGRMPDAPVPSPPPSSVGLLRRAAHAITTTSDSAGPATSPTQTLVGILLIALAQLFTASQFVIEESIMSRYALSPLHVVGWEGTFGLVFTLLSMVILHFSYGRTPAGRGGYFDVTAGWHDIITHRAIAVTSLLIMFSIGGFNFFGLSVTRTVSATSRSTIDTCRTLFIWVFSLGLGWEGFKWLQVVGFAALVYGTFVFNEIVRPPGLPKWCCGGGGRRGRDAEDESD